MGDSVVLDWTDSSNIPDQIVVFATSSYLNGATTLTIPDLSGVTGFLPSASSGTTINWGVSQRGGTYQTFEATPSDGSWGFASVSGTFTEP